MQTKENLLEKQSLEEHNYSHGCSGEHVDGSVNSCCSDSMEQNVDEQSCLDVSTHLQVYGEDDDSSIPLGLISRSLICLCGCLVFGCCVSFYFIVFGSVRFDSVFLNFNPIGLVVQVLPLLVVGIILIMY